MNQLMKQAKKMQEEMMKAQEALGEKTVEGFAGGGAVTVVANGHKQIQSVVIRPEAVDPDDVEMLQDLVLTAVNDALKKSMIWWRRNSVNTLGGSTCRGYSERVRSAVKRQW